MATQAQRLSSSAQEDRGRSPTVCLRRRYGLDAPALTSAILLGLAVRDGRPHSRNDVQQISIVVKFGAVRSRTSPPPPDTAW